MNPTTPALAPLATAVPLHDVRFLRLGASRVGRFLAALLVTQGATEVKGSAPDATVDIVIDDRTGADDAGQDLERWRAGHPNGISLKYTDFPRQHPAWTGRSQLVDEFIHAELGLNRMAPGAALRPEPLAVATSYGAVWGALYLAAALQQRVVHRKGCHIELPLFSAAVTVLGRRLVTADDPKLVDPLEQPHMPLAEIYECSDGRYVQNHGMFWPFVAIACRAFGHEDWVADAVAGMDVLPDRATEQMWRDRFANAFRTKPAAEWERILNDMAGACTMCRTREEWMAVPHPYEASIFTARNPITIGAGTTVQSPAGPPPGASNRTEEPRVWHAPTGADKALPLAGIRVVDLCIILAGPTCGRTLAELGADVIKVDAADRTISPFGWLDVNRAKRSILIDIKKPAGLKILQRLVMSSDVVLQNLRRGKLEKLGLGYDDLRRVRPDIVYASLNAFDFGGPWSDRAGWEHNAQAASGMQVARAENGVPQQVPIPINDFATGLFGAYGVVMALRQRALTGKGAFITGSLSRTATFIQSDEYRGMTPEGPATQVIRCSDGWVRCIDDDALARSGLSAEGLASATCKDAVAALRAKGVLAVVERTLAELTRANWLDESGLRTSWTHKHLGNIRQVSAVASRQGVPKRTGWPAADRGDDTAAVLEDMGFGTAEIDAMLADRVVYSRMATF